VTDAEPQPPAILASDAERERAIERLQGAVVEGRLTLEEFSERVESAQQARTDHELAALHVDLPADRSAGAEVAAPASRYTALCSHLVRTGPWELQSRAAYRSICGTIDLDLSQARLPGREVDLDVYNFAGTVTLIIPEGVRVSVEGGGPFASQKIEAPAAPPTADAPLVRIRLRGPFGTLHVRSRPPRRSAIQRLLGGG